MSLVKYSKVKKTVLFSLFFIFTVAIFLFSVNALPLVRLSNGNVSYVVFNSSDYWGNLYKTVGSNFFGQTCAGDVVSGTYANGSLVCVTGGAGGGVSSVTRGFGFNLSGTSITTTGTLNINSSVIQSRVSGTCAAGSSIRSINEDGSIGACETDSVGISSETDPLFTAENVSLWNEARNKYNSTYALYSYNHTQAANTSIVTNYGKWFYNMSISNNSIYNETYARWAYNQTGLITYNSTYANYAYNQTIFNQSVYNNTYNNLLSQNCPTGYVVNGTLINGTLICKLDSTSAGGMDYTNVALTNISETWDAGQNITMGVGGWFKGLLDWSFIMNVPAFLDSLTANNTYIKLSDLPLNNKTLPNWNNITNIPAGFADGVDDTGGASTTNTDDLDINLSEGYILFEPFTTSNTAETGELGQLGWSFTVQGTGASVANIGAYSGNHPGLMRLSSGTVAFSNASLELGITSMVIDTTSGNMTQEWLVNCSRPNNATDNYTLFIGLHDSIGATASPTDGVYFVYNSTLVNWSFETANGGNKINNVTSVPMNANYTKLKIEILNVSGIYYEYAYINGVRVAIQNSSRLPTTSARVFGPNVQLKKNQGATAVTCDMDYFYFKQKFAIPR